jgi:UDP-3-O-[3-hydroxymyristoyl] glucosamine N-acyltransferase
MLEFSAQEIAAVINGKIEGDAAVKVFGIAKIEEANAQSLCFIANPKYEHFAATTTAGILIVNEGLQFTNPNIGAVIRVKDAYSAFTQLLDMYQKMQQTDTTKQQIETHTHIGKDSVHGANLYLGSFSYIGNRVKIGENVKIYPHSYVGDDCEIGDNTIIYSGVNIYYETKIGANCIFHSGAVIGADGFGFAPAADGTYKKIPQTGNVIIEDDVEIGANTTVDRATLGSTILRKGVKLDNLIQVAHNVEIGENTVIAALVGISGSAKLGKNMMVGGQAGITGHITLANGTKVQAKAAVIRDQEEENKGLSGVPAIDAREHYRQLAAIKKLPELYKKVDELEKLLKTKIGNADESGKVV